MKTETWWFFATPNFTFVPGETAEEARASLKRYCYVGAPVDEWPCLGFFLGTRRDIAGHLLSLLSRHPSHSFRGGR